MALKTNIQRRDSGYYFRIRVPLDLADTIKQREVVKSLNTNCPKHARINAHKVGFEVLQWFEGLRRDHKSRYVTTNSTQDLLPMGLAKKNEALTLPELLEDWATSLGLASEDDRNQSSNYTESLRVVKKFTELCGTEPIEDYERADLEKLKQHYFENGLKAKTIGKYVGLLSKIIKHGLKNDLIQSDPFPKGAYEVKRSKQDQDGSNVRPYKLKELRTVFNAPLYTGMQSKRRPHNTGDTILKDHRYWLPLIALYSGMRETEIIQLTTDDIKEESGIRYFDINQQKPHQKLKTAKSKRLVPIHAELIRCGFIDYVEELKTKHSKEIASKGWLMLFPEVKANNKEQRLAKSFSQFFGRFSDNIGLQDSRINFHSFRHTFKDACREAEIARDVHDRLTGHTDPSVSAQYGSGFTIKRLAEGIQSIAYQDLSSDRLDLSHLHTKEGLQRWKKLETHYQQLGIEKQHTPKASQQEVTKYNPDDYQLTLLDAFNTLGESIYGADWDKDTYRIGIKAPLETKEITSQAPIFRLLDRDSLLESEQRKEKEIYLWEEEYLDDKLEQHCLEIKHTRDHYAISTQQQSEQFRTVMDALLNGMKQDEIDYFTRNAKTGQHGKLPDEVFMKNLFPLHFDLLESVFVIDGEKFEIGVNEESLIQHVRTSK